MLWTFYLTSCIFTVSSSPVLVADVSLVLACDREPTLPNCFRSAEALGTRSFSVEEQIKEEKENFRQAAADRAACIELREEYIKVCAVSSSHRMENESQEFCEAYETVCFEIPEGEPDQPTAPTIPPMMEYFSPPPPKRKSKDYAELCLEYKQRYLYVCPDPFRFGQKAIIFCPLYAQKCHVPLPEKPVVPTRAPTFDSRSVPSAVDRLCAQYRTFALSYCNDPLILSQPRYKDACDKYNRFCIRG